MKLEKKRCQNASFQKMREIEREIYRERFKGVPAPPFLRRPPLDPACPPF